MSKQSTGHTTGTGKGGFTLIELLIVMSLLGILVGIAVPMYQNSVLKAREATLKEDLYQMRDAIDKHYSDLGMYPENLSKLSEKRYIRSVPIDPFTNSNETWVVVKSEDASGVFDVKSGSSSIGTNGIAYNEW